MVDRCGPIGYVLNMTKVTKKNSMAYGPLAIGMLVGLIITSCILFFFPPKKTPVIEKNKTAPIIHEPRFEFYTELEGK